MATADGTICITGTPVAASDTTQQLTNFWNGVLNDIKNLQKDDFKTQELPLARIKKIMKLDEEVKMISAEAPLVFSKACELFVKELTLRAWTHTEDNKRRTLQRNDIAMAVSKFDQFDFLIDIVPRDELKQPTKRADEGTPRAGALPEQIQYVLTAPTMQQNTPAAQPQTHIIQIPGPDGQIIQQQIQIQGAGDGSQAQQILIQPQAAAQAQQPQQIQQVQVQQQQPQAAQATPQVFQQVTTPSGEMQTIPVQLTQEQFMAIQQRMQGKQPGEQIVLQTVQPATTQAAETSLPGVVQSQFSNATQPLFQIQNTVPQQILVQSADGSGDQTVDLADVSTQ